MNIFAVFPLRKEKADEKKVYELWRGGRPKIGLSLEIDIDTPCIAYKEIPLVNKGVMMGGMTRGSNDLNSLHIEIVWREESILWNGFNLPVFESEIAQNLFHPFPESLRAD